MVEDINPSGDSSPWELTDVNGILYFRATNGTDGNELWRSNGTALGTFQLRDINPGSGSSTPMGLKNVNGVLYFSAFHPSFGREPSISDGTFGGTVLLKDVNPGTGSSDPENFVGSNGMVYFTADDGTHGVELWNTDGTPAQTRLVKDINPGSADAFGFLPSLVGSNGRLFFTADDGVHDTELWRSDGSDAGTVMVKDINPNENSVYGSDMIAFNGTLLFSADDGIIGHELWSHDTADTTAPTVASWSFDPTVSLSLVVNLTEASDATSIQPSDLVVVQLLPSGNVNFTPAAVQQSNGRSTLTFTLPPLPDGDYRFRLLADRSPTTQAMFSLATSSCRTRRRSSWLPMRITTVCRRD